MRTAFLFLLLANIAFFGYRYYIAQQLGRQSSSLVAGSMSHLAARTSPSRNFATTTGSGASQMVAIS